MFHGSPGVPADDTYRLYYRIVFTTTWSGLTAREKTSGLNQENLAIRFKDHKLLDRSARSRRRGPSIDQS